MMTSSAAETELVWMRGRRPADMRQRSSPRFHRAFSLSLGLRLMALCLVGVAVFIWYSPQINTSLPLSGLAKLTGELHQLFTSNSSRKPPGTAAGHSGQQ